jgi:hypothetical protein
MATVCPITSAHCCGKRSCGWLTPFLAEREPIFDFPMCCITKLRINQRRSGTIRATRIITYLERLVSAKAELWLRALRNCRCCVNSRVVVRQLRALDTFLCALIGRIAWNALRAIILLFHQRHGSDTANVSRLRRLTSPLFWIFNE